MMSTIESITGSDLAIDIYNKKGGHGLGWKLALGATVQPICQPVKCVTSGRGFWGEGQARSGHGPLSACRKTSGSAVRPATSR